MFAITTLNLPNAVFAAFYAAQLVASGGVAPYSFSVAAGLLPDGLVLNQITGLISGTPTNQIVLTDSDGVILTDTDGEILTDSVGAEYSETFTIRATDSAGAFVNKQFTIFVEDTVAPVITSFAATAVSSAAIRLDLAAFDYVGVASVDLDFSIDNINWSPLVAAAAYFDGYSFLHQGRAIYTRYFYRATARDSAGNASERRFADARTFSPPIVFQAPVLPPATFGNFYSVPLLASGGVAPLRWHLAETELSSNLTLSEDGVLSGIPAFGAHSLLVQVSDNSGQTVNRTLLLFAALSTPALLKTPFNPYHLIPEYYNPVAPDWEKVTGDHTYQDGGKSFNSTNSVAPIEFEFVFTGLTKAEAAVFDQHYDSARGELFDFPFLTRDNEFFAHGTRYKTFRRRHDKNRRWIQERQITLIRYP